MHSPRFVYASFYSLYDWVCCLVWEGEMRRYTDLFVMLALLVLDFLIAVIMWNTVDDALNPGSTSLAYMIMSLTLIAIPGIAMAAGQPKLSQSNHLWDGPEGDRHKSPAQNSHARSPPDHHYP